MLSATLVKKSTADGASVILQLLSIVSEHIRRESSSDDVLLSPSGTQLGSFITGIFELDTSDNSLFSFITELWLL